MIGSRIDFARAAWVGTLSVEQWVLRAGLAGAGLASLVVTHRATPTGVGWFWIVLVVLATAWAFFTPDSAGPGCLIAALVVAWWTQVEEPVSWHLCLLALGVLVIHAAAALAAAGPPAGRIRTATLRRWSAATAVVASACIAVWLVYLILEQAAMRASTLRLVVALVIVALLAWWIRLRSIDLRSEGGVSRREMHP